MRAGVLLGVLAALAGGVFGWFVWPTERCVGSSKIVNIGGCSISGYCGVLLANGESKRVENPVVGGNACVKWETTNRLNWSFK